ncbi:hypothetical protein DFH07DRAFT_761577 [Mycena maculata]|uniref:Uncharacterized protein n=1 Tax=Mycena maculata TaxID=230809 RepID=A0AAD7HDQ6_9AGAR|nr:hypothetical protein DFH07DRAFT_761577 [Mycena maculata]
MGNTQLDISSTSEDERVNAFWSVVILDNFWVVANGSPTSIPYGINIDTPWPSSSEVRFLDYSRPVLIWGLGIGRCNDKQVLEWTRFGGFMLLGTPCQSINTI